MANILGSSTKILILALLIVVLIFMVIFGQDALKYLGLPLLWPIFAPF